MSNLTTSGTETIVVSPGALPVPAAEAAGELTDDLPSRFVRWVRRHPLGAFVTLAYTMSWSAWLLAFLGGGVPLMLLGAFGPAVGAGLVTYCTGGSVRDWLRPLARWRVPARFYVYALGLPVALFAAMNVELALLGHDVELGRLSDAIPAYLGTFLFVALVGGGQEEPGWRGFALDRFQVRHSPIGATLWLGVVWGLWHLPLYGLGFVGPLMFVFFYTWLYNRSGSVLLCVLLHASFTPALDHLVLADDSPTVDAVIVMTMLAGVFVLIALTRGRLGFDHRAGSTFSAASPKPPVRDGSDASPPHVGARESSGARSDRITASAHGVPSRAAEPSRKEADMTVVEQHRTPSGHHDGGHRLALRHRSVAVATGIAGVALAVLVGHNGSPAWQIARVAGVAVLTVAVLAVQARLGNRGFGCITVAVGIVALAVGAGFLPYVVKDGLSLEALAGMVALVGGVVLAAAGTVLGSRGRRIVSRVGAGTGTLLVAAVVTFVVAPAVAATNVPRPQIGETPADKGLAYQSVTVTTGDGVELAGWYLASTNRAAVVLLHGAGSTRSDVLDEAAVIARHGFGILMIDARGHGDSDGRAMDFGWHGDSDIAAATGYLANRPDVDPQRIGVVGMSMGGEEALGASATNEMIRAVVAEGATARTADDEAWLSDQFGFRGAMQEQLERLQDWVTDALTSASVPTSSRSAIERSGKTRYLLITAGDIGDEGHAAAYVAAGAPDRVRTWTVAGSGHTGGLQTQPEEWESRVIGFLTFSLGTSN